MKKRTYSLRSQVGFSMIEVMVSLVILLLGLLGLVGLIVTSQRAETESYQRAQALLLLQDMVGRINANRRVAPCYAITTDVTNGAPAMGTGSTVAPSCGLGSVQAYTLANSDLTAWNNLLLGTTETVSVSNVVSNAGAMVGARGCVSVDAVTGIYWVTVAWQGIAPTAAPVSSLTCGKNLYGNEQLRRVVSMPVQIANLN
ncbi:MAG: type IV pilus modification protein PilV [Polaromonas sp.]